MGRNTVILAALVGVAGIAALVLFSASGPDLGGGAPGREPGAGTDGDPGSGGPAAGAEPRPPARVADLFSERPERAGRELAARLEDPAEARKIAAEILALPTPEERARAFLRLLRTGDPAAADFVRAAVAGDHGADLRIPAILSLAGGGPAEIAVLEGIVRAWDDDGRAAAAVLALHLTGRAEGQTALAALVESSIDPNRRIAVYDALGGGVEGLALGSDLFVELRGGPGALELRPDEQFPAPYRRVVTAIAAESDHQAMPSAASVLARLPGADARGGILEIWERADRLAREFPETDERAHVRDHVFVAVSSGLRPGDAATVARMAATLSGPRTIELRRQAFELVREANGPGLGEAIRDWAAKEEEPMIREGLEEALRRIEQTPPEEIR